MRLTVFPQGAGSQVDLDLEGTDTVSSSFSVAELGDVTSRNSPFSKTFSIPQSERNSSFFESWYALDVSTQNFDVRQKVRCVIEVEGQVVLSGYLQLREALMQDRTFTVAVFGDAANLFQEIGDKVLRDAFVFNGVTSTNYDYTQTAQNMVDSWDTSNDITTGTVGNGTVIVPIIDYGQNGSQLYYHTSGFGGLDFGLAAPGTSASSFKPSIRLKTLFDLLLSRAGYTYESTFLNSSKFNTIYMELGSDEQFVVTRPYYGFRVQKTGDQSITASTATLVSFANDSTLPAYDPDNVWDTGASEFTSPAEFQGGNFGTSGLNGYLFLSVDYSDASYVSSVIDFTVTVTTPTDSVTDTFSLSQGDTSVALPIFNLDIDSGDVMQVFVSWEDNPLGTGVVSVSQNTPNGNPSYLTINPMPGNAISIPDNMPDIRQRDFMRDIIQRFNLILEAQPNNERHLVIEPWEDWVALGVEVDWTEKLDVSPDKQVVKKPTTEFKKSVIEFADLEGADAPNEYRQRNSGHVFGRYKENVDDDFAQGDLNNDPIFKPFHALEVVNFQGVTEVPNMIIARHYEITVNGNERISDPPTLFYYHGLKDVGNNGETIYIESVSSTQFPLCTAFSESPVTGDTVSLYWDYQYPYSFGTPSIGSGYVNNGYYRTYWAKYLNNIYAKDAHILEGYFYLTPGDILNLKFNNLYRIMNQVYRLNKVENYVIGGYETTKVQLIADQSALAYQVPDDCEYIPSQYLLDGTINFVSVLNGSETLDPGQSCCEFHGGTYENNVCRWREAEEEDTVALGFRSTLIQNPAYPVTSQRSNEGATVDTQRIVLSATSVFGSTEQAVDSNGMTIPIPDNVVLRVNVSSLSVQTTYDGTSGSRGATSLREYLVTAKNIDGTASASVLRITGSTIDDTGVVRRNVTVTTSGSNLVINVDGETHCQTLFTLDCMIHTINVVESKLYEDAILAEDGSYLVTESGHILIQE